MPFGLGFGETILILAIVLIFFGPRRMPEMGASLGKGIRDFKRALNGISAEINDGANPLTRATHQPFPVPAQTVVAAPSDPAAVAVADATVPVPETTTPVEIDVVSTPIGQVAADHPTFQPTAAASPADVGAPVRLDAPAAEAERQHTAPSA
ncbi:MAG TPA: twin-arginine translocase TatA/TatE family subunit [Longimicrobiaceae bacterium]|nr:twin-arginine translocase TatA/TatE family subunit [Longimicrobiaceae bacterium]